MRNVVPQGGEQDSSDTSACVSKPSVTTTASTSSQGESTSHGGKEAGGQDAFLEEADYDASNTSKQDRLR